MKLSRRARRSAALAATHGSSRRRTYCRHWSVIQLVCTRGLACQNPDACEHYEDAEAYHLARLRQEGRLLERTV